MDPKKRTHWLCIILWTVVHVLDIPRVDGVDDVPREFRHLEHYRVSIAGEDGNNLDLRTKNENLQLWKETSQKGDSEETAQVVSRTVKENNKELERKIPDIGIDQEIILQLGSDDVVQRAADHLLNKETATNRPKALLEYDTQSDQFRLIKSKENNAIDITENTKITVVGHGGQRDGRVSVGGRTSDQLAKDVLKLRELSSPIHWSSGSHKIVEEISIVSCDTGAGEGGKTFAKDFLLGLDNAGLSTGSLSLRTTKTIVQEDGSKRTVDFDNPELWGKYIPKHKRKFYLDNNKNLMEESISTYRSPEWIESQNMEQEYDPLAPRTTENKPQYYHENGVLYHINDEIVGQVIETNVRELFSSEVQETKTEDLVVYYRKSMARTDYIKQEKIKVQVVEGLDGLKENIKDMIQSSNEIRRGILNRKAHILRRYGIIFDNNRNLKETWQSLSNQRRNPEIKAILNEIQETLQNTVKYYRFKDYIYSMNLKDFYVKLYGTTDHRLINDEFCEFRNKNHVPYDDMKSMKSPELFVEMAQKWVSNEHNAIGEINPHNGMAVLATHISEAVRNPKMFIINRLLWDTETSWRGFRSKNPMARGRTWRGNPAAIGLDFETTEEGMSDQVAQETVSAMKLWLTRKFRTSFYDYKPKNLPEPRDMSLDDANRINERVARNLPLHDLNIDVDCRTPVRIQKDLLAEGYTSSFQDLEERARGKSLETEFQLKMAEDRQQLKEMITENIKKEIHQNLGEKWKIKSIENDEHVTMVKLENMINPVETKKIQVPGEKGSLSSEEVLHSYYNDLSGSEKVNRGLGIYGTLMGFQGANQMFAEGRNTEGGIMLAQGVHGVTELTGINSAVNKFVGNVAQKSISQISSGLEEASAAKFTSALAEAGEAARAIPILSLGFTVFNIYEDLQQKTPVGIVDATLDSMIFISTLAGPEMLPVTVALSIIRLGIDPMYYEIKHKLDALPTDASVGDKVKAVVKGIGLALRDIGYSFLQIWEQIGLSGFIHNINNLAQEHNKSMDLVHNLQTAENYYKILDIKDGNKCHKMMDFTQGDDSAYGGNVRVELTDQSTMIITLTDPLTSNRIVKVIPFETNCELVDLVMGIGETVNIKMMQKTATMFWILPLMKEDVISSMTPDNKSLHGTYVGNSKPNRFYAVQQNIIKGLSYTQDRYHYELFGNDGNDIFYLGPQKTFAHGGNGQDIYYILENAGQTEICNQANDKEMDLLILNIPLQQINAKKVQNDLKLFNNNHHEILIKNWFIGEDYRHMTFTSVEGALFKTGQVRLDGIVPLEPSLDLSSKDSGAQIYLNESLLETVVTVIGSNHNDMIYGNRLNNVFQGRGGKNYLSGSDGKDMYIIQEKEDCDTINNFAFDGLVDIVQLPVIYANLKVDTVAFRSLKISESIRKTCVIMENWYRGWRWHVIFISQDYVVFQITNTSQPQMIPLILDYSRSPKGINIDLNTLSRNENIMTVIGSSHFDTIYGNEKPNFIQATTKKGFLKGRGGSDTYVIDCREGNIEIDNYAEDGAIDVLFIKSKYISLDFKNVESRSRSTNFFRKHLKVYVGRHCSISLLDWYKSERYRHLQFQTEDGITFSIPSELTTIIFAVDNSRDTIPTHFIDTRSGIYTGTTKIMGPPRFITIFGNWKDNYIDPGTNGGIMAGGAGSDTYVLRKHYRGQYTIYNDASDLKVDYLILDINFKDILLSFYKDYNYDTHLLISAPTAAQWKCKLEMFGRSKDYTHFIVKTNDVWFTFSVRWEIQPLFVDERFSSMDLHLDLSSKSLHEVPTVYGSLHKRNFITGNSLSNTIVGGKDTDVLYGLEGDDVLQGSSGKDYLYGGAGDDKIHGGEGNDLILCGEGDDVIYPSQGADAVYGGTGSDTLLFFGDLRNKTGVFVNLDLGYGAGSDAEGDLYFGMENVVGTSYDDILIGNDESNYIRGAGGNDLIQPLGGDDFLQGGEGKDIYNLMDDTGTKMIDNYANDNIEDIIYINHSVELEIIKKKSQDNLHITIDHKKNEKFKIIVKNWFKSEKYRHLKIQVLEREFTNGNEKLQVYKEELSIGNSNATATDPRSCTSHHQLTDQTCGFLFSLSRDQPLGWAKVVITPSPLDIFYTVAQSMKIPGVQSEKMCIVEVWKARGRQW
ncbi:LOW QUALITY PROTEIN: uncharacterized protein ACNLHF_007129 [Anomaloglossus baeobatrachus]